MSNSLENNMTKFELRDFVNDDVACEHEFVNDFERGELVCTKCGLVSETGLISPEYSLSGGYEKVVTSNISNYRYAMAKLQCPAKLQRALRLDRQQKWSERRVILGLEEIRRICSVLVLTENLKEAAQYLFRKAIKLECFATRYIALIAQVTLYYTVKNQKSGFFLIDHIIDEKFSQRIVSRYYMLLIQQLKLQRPISEPTSVLPELCSRLNLENDILGIASDALKTYLQKHNISGLDTKGIAAGVIYYICRVHRIPRSQTAIAKVAQISDLTLRQRFKEIEHACGHSLNMLDYS